MEGDLLRKFRRKLLSARVKNALKLLICRPLIGEFDYMKKQANEKNNKKTETKKQEKKQLLLNTYIAVQKLMFQIFRESIFHGHAARE